MVIIVDMVIVLVLALVVVSVLVLEHCRGVDRGGSSNSGNGNNH